MTSAFSLVLDTTPPTLDITLTDRVTPPEDVLVTIVASEDIGTSSYTLVDASGSSWAVGATRLDARTDIVRISSVWLAGGDGWLLATVTDLVGNTITRRTPFYVARSITYDLDLDTDLIFALELNTMSIDSQGYLVGSSVILEVQVSVHGTRTPQDPAALVLDALVLNPSTGPAVPIDISSAPPFVRTAEGYYECQIDTTGYLPGVYVWRVKATDNTASGVAWQEDSFVLDAATA